MQHNADDYLLIRRQIIERVCRAYVQGGRLLVAGSGITPSEEGKLLTNN